MHNFAFPKNRYEFISKKLNGERLVNLKHKSPENKEIMKILVRQGYPQHYYGLFSEVWCITDAVQRNQLDLIGSVISRSAKVIPFISSIHLPYLKPNTGDVSY